MALESERVQLLNNQAMRKEKANMAEGAYQQLKENKELKLKCRACFRREDVTKKEVKTSHCIFHYFSIFLLKLSATIGNSSTISAY